MKRLLSACLLMAGTFFYWSGAVAESNDNRTADAIQSAMYYNADIRDAEECSMEVRNGQMVALSKDGKLISNPAMTCPDMFSWKLFVDVVKDRFWSNWADESQNWPAKPYPLCEKGESGDCCTPGSNNDKDGHCPYYPGDAHKDRLTALTNAVGSEAEKLAEEILRVGRIPFVDHMNTRQPLKKDGWKLFKSSGDSQNTTPSCDAVVVNGTSTNVVPQILQNFNPPGSESIGRVIRQTNAEVTVRNKTFHEYLYYNDLYNANGVADIYKRNADNLAQDCEIDGNQQVCSNAPYHQPNHSYSAKNKTPSLATVDLPFDAIMIKSNWLHKDLANALNLKGSDKDYVSKHLATQISLDALSIPYDKKANPGGQCNLKGSHYLVAFHVSSKDVPNWVWTTFEHKDLPGRCDYTGCNDAFGYQSQDDLPTGVAKNYVAPNERSDHLNSPSMVFGIDQGYPEEQRTTALTNVFNGMNIGTGDSTSPSEPDPEDKAWLNYRLKGSQVEFVTSTGRPTFLGNSVTEGGFMDGSSCITCHARAGVYVSENDEIDFARLSVFMRSITDYGYARSANGIPNPSWYNVSENPPRLEVLQTDFIWGFLNAQPLDD
ncbi:hypothetical protein [Kistimonas asteriae]|uniref:hypothetical protein n=1 Tax=Kistimonas asteriae TaxID=517724 RepID=UPI001BA660DF|nr:hypothetical protein [Kistimonas asteriae]